MPAKTDKIACPVCGVEGSVRGIKHHYTTMHNGGQPGGLIIATVVLEADKVSM